MCNNINYELSKYFILQSYTNNFSLQFLWMPYNRHEELIPEYCMRNQVMWRSSCPLICMHIIEWHHPDRVLRQFGMDQPRPDPPMDLDYYNVHGITLKGRIDNEWEVEHRYWLSQWDIRYQTVSGLPLRDEPLHRNSEYMQWYRSVTRRWIDPRSASSGYVVRKS
jgi:Plant mobile domain